MARNAANRAAREKRTLWATFFACLQAIVNLLYALAQFCLGFLNRACQQDSGSDEDDDVVSHLEPELIQISPPRHHFNDSGHRYERAFGEPHSPIATLSGGGSVGNGLTLIEHPYNCNLGVNSKQKYYAVAKGRTPGIYLTWEETERQVSRFSGAKHKSFKCQAEALGWLNRELYWSPSNSGNFKHRESSVLVGVDLAGHQVYRCECCDEIFCSNGHI